jgi:hypothetical protein
MLVVGMQARRKLLAIEFGIAAVTLDQLYVCAALHDSTFFEIQDQVGPRDDGKIVRNREGGSSPSETLQCLQYRAFVCFVEPGGWFVENKNRRLPEGGACQGQSLTLSV